MLTKADINDLIASERLFSRDYGPDDDLEQQVQPASMDITIGDIHVPPNPAATNDPWKTVAVFNDTYPLKPGSVVLIRSRERLDLPSTLGGLVFPKNGHFALKGVLFTNFGHIDPGFEGYLKFTVINMGAETLLLERGMRIAGVVLFKLTAGTDKYKPRHDADNFYAHAKSLPRDFLNVSERIATGVKDRITQEWAIRDRRNMYITMGGAIFAVVVTIWIGILAFVGPLYSEVWKLEQKVDFITVKAPK